VDPVTQSRDLAPDGGQVDAGLAPDADDETALLPVEVAAGSVAVTPDAEVLTGADTVFPVFIDPSIGVNRSEWTMVSSIHDPQWKWTGDEGMGYCATYRGYWCGSGFKKRLFFEFTRSRLVGKEVLDATFAITEVWSMSCEASWVDLRRVDGGISSSTKWPGPASVDLMVDRKVAYGRGSACSPSAPAQPVEFNDNDTGDDIEENENLTDTVQDFAEGKWSRLTLMLRAKDESDPNGWKRFKNDAVLSVVYIPIPDKPKPVGVRPNNSTEVDCSTDPKDPVVADRATPVVVGTPQVTAVAKKDPTQSLQVEFAVQRYDTTTKTGTQVWSDYEPDSGWVADGKQQSTTVKAGVLQDNVTYRLRARTQSHASYKSKGYDRWSPYSTWCYFKVDSTAPAPPVITSTGVYQECTAEACPAAGGPGEKGGFTFSPAAGSTDVVKYRWLLQGDGAPTATTTVTGKTATVTVTPPLAGTYRLRVEAYDALRQGTPAYYQFRVAAPPGPVGAWSFTEASGTVAADATTVVTTHPLTLAGGAAFDARARRGDLPADQSADHSLGLNGSTGYAAASGPVLNHTTSFTVSGWAYLTDAGHNSVVLGQTADDATSAGFALYYSTAYHKWIFNWHWIDPATGKAKFIRSLADLEYPATKVWTHLTGVYDTQASTIQLYVNGRPQGTPVPLTGAVRTVSTAGAFQVGRASVEKVAFTDYFTGLIDEVNAWQRALTPDEVAEQAVSASAEGDPATALVASWSADTGAVTGGTTIPDASAYGRGNLTLSESGAALDVESGLITLTGSGSATANGPVVDETGSFTVAATASVDSAALAKKAVGYRAQVAGQRSGTSGAESSWAIWYEQVSVSDGVPLGVWTFGRTGVDGSGAATTRAVLASTDPAMTDTHVQLTGVYDATDRSLRLYVDVFSQDDSATPPVLGQDQQGFGELTVGRGRRAGAWGDGLPGTVSELRLWAGAMTNSQVAELVLGAEL